MYKEIIDFLKDKYVAIVGFGKEGKSTYNFLRKYLPNQRLVIIDGNKDLLDNNAYLNNDKNIELVLGDNYLDNLDKYDVIIKSPGVRFKNIDISKFEDKITSQLGLVLDYYKDNIIGITGTKGKSTTTSLITKILKDQGIDAYLLGNIGIPIFDNIDKMNEKSMMVIEMAALQLEFVKNSPHIGIVLNLFEEHLDFFKDKNAYFLAKMNMFKYQNENDYGIYTSSNDTLESYVNQNNYKSHLIDVRKDLKIEDNYIVNNSKKLYNISSERHLLGDHNLSNIMFALEVSKILDLDILKVSNSINEFKPLEHRMEYVDTINGVKYYNDSIATIPAATINCVNALKDVDTIIFGGMDRGIDYSALIEFFNNSDIKNFICMPETGYKIGKEIKGKNVYFIDDLKDAVKKAKEVTKKICVMSPAASSYNAFKNFEEKGRTYKAYVKES